MSINPTYVYFGQTPTSIIMQSSGNFDGTAELSVPTLTPGIYTFPSQAGGGLYNFHSLLGTQEAISIKSICYTGGGTLTVKKQITTAAGSPSITIGTVVGSGEFTTEPIIVAANENIIFTSAGATNPVVVVTASLARSVWTA